MFEAIKKLGQNFLMDSTVAEKMANAFVAQDPCDVIEIGPGLGAVTEKLFQKFAGTSSTIYAVEVDSRFIPKLEEMYVTTPQLIVINQDILSYLPKFDSSRATYVVGSLPFYITSPIIHAIVKMQTQPESVVILIQKEVAQKIASDAPDGSYIASFVQTFYNTEIIEIVSRTKFTPVPEVDGAVLLLTKKSNIKFDLSKYSIEKYEGFLHRAYKNPRKMLNKAFSKQELVKMNIEPNLRPQAVAAESWADAYNLLNT